MTSPSVTDVHPSQSDLVCLLNRLNDWQATTPPTPREIKAGTLVIWETRRRFQENRIPPLQIIASAMSWLCSTTCTTSFPQSHPNNRTRCRRAERENWGTMCLRVKGTLWCYYHFIRRFFFFLGCVKRCEEAGVSYLVVESVGRAHIHLDQWERSTVRGTPGSWYTVFSFSCSDWLSSSLFFSHLKCRNLNIVNSKIFWCILQMGGRLD